MMEAQSLASDQYFVWSHVQTHAEVRHLLQEEEDWNATLLDYVHNREYRRLRLEPNFSVHDEQTSSLNWQNTIWT